MILLSEYRYFKIFTELSALKDINNYNILGFLTELLFIWTFVVIIFLLNSYPYELIPLNKCMKRYLVNIIYPAQIIPSFHVYNYQSLLNFESSNKFCFIYWKRINFEWTQYQFPYTCQKSVLTYEITQQLNAMCFDQVLTIFLSNII